MPTITPPIERFNSKIDRSGGPDACWPWTAGRQKDKRGVEWYGIFHPVKGTTVRAHRYALEQSLGRPIAPGMWALHTCDNPPCVNPAHLYEGDHQQNEADKVARDRQHKGMTTPTHKVTDADVVAIRTRFDHGETITTLCEEYGLSLRGGVSKIINGQTWKHVGGPIRINPPLGRRPGTPHRKKVSV